MKTVSVPAALLAAALCAACWDKPTYVRETPMPSERADATPRSRLSGGSESALLETGLPAGPVRDRVDAFAAEVAGRLQRSGAGSAGVFPLVTYDQSHDGAEKGPWVSELGEAVADEVSDALARELPQGFVLGPLDLAVRAADVNLPRESLATLVLVKEQAPRLGLDAVVFGTIERRDHVGERNRHELTLELSCYDLSADAVVAKESFRLPSDRAENAPVWSLAQRESTWLPAKRWPIPEPEPTLTREVEVACKLMARRLAAQLASVRGKVYVPPADTARFVGSVARLRSAQAALAQELARRAEGKGGKGDGPVVLNGIEFQSLQVAEAYTAELAEDLSAGAAMRFAENVSSLLGDALRPALTSEGVLVADAGFTRWSDSQLVAGELALGGLARSQVARDALTGLGVSHVVAPRLDALGAGLQLRVDVIDLERRAVIGSTYVALPERYRAELLRQLDAPSSEPLPPVRTTEAARPAGWDKTFADAVDGVLYLVNRESGLSGTGFVVSRDGLVLTNSHVARGLGTGAVALWKDGQARSVRLVADEPDQDLALLRLDSVPDGVHVFELADASEARVGVEVAVLGHPKDTEGWVLSPGHLSSVDEEVRTESGALRPSYMYTCATRRGNSGSPVLLLDGRVVAVNSHGALGDVFDATGTEVRASRTGSEPISSELPGFARGATCGAARAFLERARTRG